MIGKAEHMSKHLLKSHLPFDLLINNLILSFPPFFLFWIFLMYILFFSQPHNSTQSYFCISQKVLSQFHHLLWICCPTVTSFDYFLFFPSLSFFLRIYIELFLNSDIFKVNPDLNVRLSNWATSLSVWLSCTFLFLVPGHLSSDTPCHYKKKGSSIFCLFSFVLHTFLQKLLKSVRDIRKDVKDCQIHSVICSHSVVVSCIEILKAF